MSAWAEGLATVEAPFRAADRLAIPSIVLGEYYFGIRQSRYRRLCEDWLHRYLPLAEIVAVTQATAGICADIRLELKQSGNPIPSNDAWIAALAQRRPIAGCDIKVSSQVEQGALPHLRAGALGAHEAEGEGVLAAAAGGGASDEHGRRGAVGGVWCNKVISFYGTTSASPTTHQSVTHENRRNRDESPLDRSSWW